MIPLIKRSLGPRGWTALLLASVLGWLYGPSPGAASAAVSDSLTITITPRDAWAPAPVTDLSGTSGAEGQLLLQWTAPDSNDDVFAQKTPAASYFLKIATFSADSVGNTTSWWNGSQPVGGLPAPSAPGTLEFMLLNGLEPGATYWAAIKSSDTADLLSLIDVRAAAPGQQSQTWVFDAAPTAPSALSVVSRTTGTISLAWTASPSTDLDFYRVYVDSTDPYDFAGAYAVAVDSPSTNVEIGSLSSGTLHHFRVHAVDKGAPGFNGLPLESGPSNAVSKATLALLRPPLAPFGLTIQYAANVAQLNWLPVRLYEDGSAFDDYNNATSSELREYHVLRATAPTKAPWTNLVALTSTTLSYADNASGPQYYYHVISSNTSGASEPSIIRAASGGAAWLVGYDSLSTLEIPQAWIDALSGSGGDPNTGYLIKTSSHPSDLTGAVLKSMEINAWRGGVALDPAVSLGGMAQLRLHYELEAGGQVAPSAAGVQAADPEELSVFWYNGNKWVQLYGTVDELNQMMSVQTRHIGRYQLRSVERPTDFAFNPAGLSNRSLTPNGDGHNDDIVFSYANPRASAVTGRILDLKGKQVATMTTGPLADSLRWDGRSNGVAVPGGVYIYQIESDGKVFTGTILVVK